MKKEKEATLTKGGSKGSLLSRLGRSADNLLGHGSASGVTSPGLAGKGEEGGRGGSLRTFASSDSLVVSPAARKAANTNGGGDSERSQDSGDEEADTLLGRGASASAEAPAGPDRHQGGSGSSQSLLASAVVTAYRAASSAVTSWLRESQAVLLGWELGGRALPALHTQVGPGLDLDPDLDPRPNADTGSWAGGFAIRASNRPRSGSRF